jgi:hypothetical protein
MFKELKTGFMKIFSKKYIPLVFLGIVILFFYSYSNTKYNVFDKMTTSDSLPPTPQNNTSNTTASANDPKFNNYNLQPVANPIDLLPKDSNSQWASLNPISQGNVAIPDLLQSGFHIGLDTIGQTLRNPNYQDRADPVIEKVNTGPWNQSTIEHDVTQTNR